MSDTEYAVEVPGRGYLSLKVSSLGSELTPELESWTPNVEVAMEECDCLVKRYRRMGCPEIAETVRLLERTVTVTFSEWKPVVGA